MPAKNITSVHNYGVTAVIMNGMMVLIVDKETRAARRVFDNEMNQYCVTLNQW